MNSYDSIDRMRHVRGWLLSQDSRRCVTQTNSGGRMVCRVPSETRSAIGYEQFIDEDGAFVCTCPDFAARHKPCKHIVEVLYRCFPAMAPPPPSADDLAALKSSEMYSGARRYKKAPFRYVEGFSESTRRDRALAAEAQRVEALLLDLGSILNSRYPQHAAHRHSLPAGDRVLALVLREYHRRSLRATPALLKPLAAAGHIAFAPCKSSLITYAQDVDTLQYLQEAFLLSIAPFRMMEQDILVDASGISPFYFESYRAVKYGKRESPATKWFRVHAAIGRLSHAVLGFSLTPSIGKGHGDVSYLIPLVDDVQRAGFEIRYVIADNAYLDLERVSELEARGSVLVAPLKGRNRNRDGSARAGVQAVQRFAERHPDLYDELLRARQPIEGFFSIEKRRNNRLIAIGTQEEREGNHRGENSGLFAARIVEFFVRMVRYNLTRINMEEHLRNRCIRFSRGSLFSHVRETMEQDDVA